MFCFTILIHARSYSAANQNVQAFNMATQQRLGAFKLPDGQSVEFWRYVDDQTVAIVTSTSVLHWTVSGNQPKKMFDRHDNLRGCKILNYEVSDRSINQSINQCLHVA